jgi:hypothetical protein
MMMKIKRHEIRKNRKKSLVMNQERRALFKEKGFSISARRDGRAD